MSTRLLVSALLGKAGHGLEGNSLDSDERGEEHGQNETQVGARARFRLLCWGGGSLGRGSLLRATEGRQRDGRRAEGRGAEGRGAEGRTLRRELLRLLFRNLNLGLLLLGREQLGSGRLGVTLGNLRDFDSGGGRERARHDAESDDGGGRLVTGVRANDSSGAARALSRDGRGGNGNLHLLDLSDHVSSRSTACVACFTADLRFGEQSSDRVRRVRRTACTARRRWWWQKTQTWTS